MCQAQDEMLEVQRRRRYLKELSLNFQSLKDGTDIVHASKSRSTTKRSMTLNISLPRVAPVHISYPGILSTNTNGHSQMSWFGFYKWGAIIRFKM
jgi:hypothetical protein